MSNKYEMPEWTKGRGGEPAWRKWLNNRAQGCHRRAKAKQKKFGGEYALTIADWKRAIHNFIMTCDGLGHYSRLPLSLADTIKKEKSSMWPSVDHLADVLTAKVVIDTRVINDMKTILSEQEFRDAISHLFISMELGEKRLIDEWRPERDY